MDRKRCGSLVEQILGPSGLTPRFQPIFRLSSSGFAVHALEGLVRGPEGTNIASPDILFEYVRRKRVEPSVDRACIDTLLEASRQLPSESRINLNVHAATLERDPGFPDYLVQTARSLGLALSRICLEVVEHAPTWDGMGFLGALRDLRTLGVEVALDDVGLGHCNYAMILTSKPDYFKIDRYFISGVSRDPDRRVVVESIAQLSWRFGGQPVAEGVESTEDLSCLVDLGIDLFQGYLLGRPQAANEVGSSALSVEPCSTATLAARRFLGRSRNPLGRVGGDGADNRARVFVAGSTGLGRRSLASAWVGDE